MAAGPRAHAQHSHAQEDEAACPRSRHEHSEELAQHHGGWHAAVRPDAEEDVSQDWGGEGTGGKKVEGVKGEATEGGRGGSGRDTVGGGIREMGGKRAMK